ncbi:MAG: DeoR family transcriptional regulator [bacterium]|nr:DeoR family transcriptional regulator [bacterium]
MEKQELIQLTEELYRLTLLFPKKEPLRYKIRELADNILANHLRLGLALGKQRELVLDICQDLRVLEGFFAVAKEQNWVSPGNLLRISGRYASMKQELEDTEVLVPETITAESPLDFNSPPKNTRRRDRILEILKGKGKAQVWEFKEIFPGVTKRTLRRDFEKLLAQDLVERIGQRNQTYYQPKPNITTNIV